MLRRNEFVSKKAIFSGFRQELFANIHIAK